MTSHEATLVFMWKFKVCTLPHNAYLRTTYTRYQYVGLEYVNTNMSNNEQQSNMVYDWNPTCRTNRYGLGNLLMEWWSRFCRNCSRKSRTKFETNNIQIVRRILLVNKFSTFLNTQITMKTLTKYLMTMKG